MKEIFKQKKESILNHSNKKIIRKKWNLEGCANVIQRYVPNVGPFFACQIICDLVECNVIDNGNDFEWVLLGPGAKVRRKLLTCMVC